MILRAESREVSTPTITIKYFDRAMGTKGRDTRSTPSQIFVNYTEGQRHATVYRPIAAKSH